MQFFYGYFWAIWKTIKCKININFETTKWWSMETKEKERQKKRGKGEEEQGVSLLPLVAERERYQEHFVLQISR